MYSIVGAISTEPVWCSCSSVPGSAVKLGQLGQRQVDLHDAAAGPPALDVAHEVVGQLARGDVVEERRAAGAGSSRRSARAAPSPSSSTTPATAAVAARAAGSTRASVRTSRAEATRPTAGSRRRPRPCRPRGSPSCRAGRRRRRRSSGAPSRRRCRARTGPAQVPMTPLTASAPLTCGDSNQSSSRSAMLIVISRVTSATVRTSRPCVRQASRSVSIRSAGLVRADLRRHLSAAAAPSTSASPPSQASHSAIASASLRDHFATSS